MPGLSVETEALRREAGKWADLAQEMSDIRSRTANLWLGVMAFFVGDATERLHHPAYRGFHDRIVSRLEGGSVEFELIAIALRRIATDYEDGEQITSDDFRATESELDRATEAHTPPVRGGGGDNYLI